eukprot:3911246-Rhodomonas_salina.6
MRRTVYLEGRRVPRAPYPCPAARLIVPHLVAHVSTRQSVAPYPLVAQFSTGHGVEPYALVA